MLVLKTLNFTSSIFSRVAYCIKAQREGDLTLVMSKNRITRKFAREKEAKGWYQGLHDCFTSTSHLSHCVALQHMHSG